MDGGEVEIEKISVLNLLRSKRIAQSSFYKHLYRYDIDTAILQIVNNEYNSDHENHLKTVDYFTQFASEIFWEGFGITSENAFLRIGRLIP